MVMSTRHDSAPRILVVEDDPVVSNVFRMTLERNGCHVLQAPGGAEAIQLLQAQDGPIDLLLSDVILGQRGYTDFLPKFREYFPSTPILLVSGFPATYLVECGLLDPCVFRAANTRFLQKPFMPVDLTRAVQQAVKSPRQLVSRAAVGGIA
jgi:two-component system, cell cycle sensor histidine kinase and response regulator CckA